MLCWILQAHVNARSSLCDCDTAKTLQSLQTFTATSHILPPATRLLISLSSSHTVKTFCSLHWCSCNTADLVVSTGPTPSRLMLQGTGFQGSQLAGGAGTQSHLKVTFRQQAKQIFECLLLATVYLQCAFRFQRLRCKQHAILSVQSPVERACLLVPVSGFH